MERTGTVRIDRVSARAGKGCAATVRDIGKRSAKVPYAIKGDQSDIRRRRLRSGGPGFRVYRVKPRRAEAVDPVQGGERATTLSVNGERDEQACQNRYCKQHS